MNGSTADTPKDKLPLPARANGAPVDAKPPPQAAPTDVLDTLSDELLAAAPGVLAKRKAKREAEFVDTVREQARILGIPLARLVAALRGKLEGAPGGDNVPDGRSFVRPKFWNPKDHAQRWSGRGAQPRWYADHLAAGGTEEECVIPEGAV